MEIALYYPEIPQNVGTLLRLGACLGVPVTLIGALTFIWDPRKIKRSVMDYWEDVECRRYDDWTSFQGKIGSSKRLIGLAPRCGVAFTDFVFQKEDVLLAGPEQSGLPKNILDACQGCVYIPMKMGLRSLNVAVATSMVLTEALRQTEGFKRSHGQDL
jgi:tRNA (cytidine/uridine-2'-O-)-methyltransferase